tara:strand:- start:4172 stop:4309 length:138 start_codon:yes stop_codon:yes gene_type:complete
MYEDYYTDDMSQDELDEYSRAMNPEDGYDFDDFVADHYWYIYEQD